MNEKEKFEGLTLDKSILDKHPNNHERRDYIRKIIPNELLYYLYASEQMSANSIVEYFKTFEINIGGAGVIINRLKNECGLTTRTSSESCLLTNVQQSKLRTLKLRYGEHVNNPSQVKEVKEKKRKKCLETYGVDNNFKSPVIKQKIKDFWVANYGVEHPSELPGFFKKVFRLSKPHRNVLAILDSMGIVYQAETNEHFKGYNPVLERRFCPVVDIYIPSKRLAVEINGCFWHAKPTLYKSTDLFNTVHGRITASQIWDRDKIKKDHIESLNFRFETIWDDEISPENIKNILDKYEDIKD